LDLKPDQRKALIQALPAGEKPKAIESGEGGNEFHMIGLSGSENNFILWDPSIDQFNSKFDSCKLSPISFELSERRINNEFLVHGCLLIYREQKELEETVHACDAWSYDYSALSERVLGEHRKFIEPDVGVSSIG
jgi:hypothetical protein